MGVYNTALNLVYYKKSLTESFNEGIRWFWISFAITVAIYGVVWLTHSVLVALYGAGAGLGGLQYAEQYDIASYRVLRNLIEGTGLQAHHIIPDRFAQLLGLNSGDMLCVVLDPSEHQIFTNMWQQYIPYGAGTLNATKEQIWEAAIIIYAEYPVLLDAAQVQLRASGN